MFQANSTEFSYEDIEKAGTIEAQSISAEASSLRWSPGFFPHEVVVTFPIGIQTFEMISSDESKVVYQSRHLIFTVWND